MIDATEEPDVRTRVLNGVAVPSVDPEEGRDAYPEHEATVIDAFRRRVRRGDRIVVVGGGWGGTTVVGARMSHFEGSVVAYEPSDEMVETLRRTVAVNRVADLVEVRHAAVGPVSDSSERIFGEAGGDSVSPESLPDCDVLDLDCEGAELDVLRRMDCRPRLLTVEAHPHLGCSPTAVETELAALGYEVVHSATIQGESRITNYVAVRDPD